MRHLPVLAAAFILICTAFTYPMPPTVPEYDLEEAIQKELITLESIEYTTTDKLRLKLRNPHKRKDIKIIIPSGLQFSSQDTSEQDQILLKGRSILVKAGRSSFPNFVTYCTQANNLSPGDGSQFSLNGTADGQLLKLAEFLADYREADYTAQHAIWAVTNDHSLKGIHHDDPVKAKAIQTFVAELTGKPMPRYTVRYRDGGPGRQAFTGEAITIQGEHEYDLPADGNFTCKIFTESGEEIKEVFNNMLQRKGHVRFNFYLVVRGLPKGKYVSRVFKGDEVFQEIWMEA